MKFNIITHYNKKSTHHEEVVRLRQNVVSKEYT